MWARAQVDQWAKETEDVRKGAPGGGARPPCDGENIAERSSVSMETRLWYMQKMITMDRIRSTIDSVFLTNNKEDKNSKK